MARVHGVEIEAQIGCQDPLSTILLFAGVYSRHRRRASAGCWRRPCTGRAIISRAARCCVQR
eukprot:2837055-Pleurochrysis_carterae.AAC.1